MEKKSKPQKIKKPVSIETPPDSLDEIGKAEWVFIVAALKELGLLDKHDRSALFLYCDAFSRVHRMNELIQKHPEGEVITATNGYSQANPAIKIMESASATCMKWLIQFGLTPTARQKLELKRDEGFDPELVKMVK